MPGENDGRIDDAQKSLDTEMGGEGRMSLPPISGRNEEKKIRGGSTEDAYTGLQSEYSLAIFSLGHSICHEGLSHGSGDVSLVWISS